MPLGIDGAPSDLESEIAHLETQLKNAKSRLALRSPNSSNGSSSAPSTPYLGIQQHALNQTDTLHALILLADSQLPIGSFAFSSGLESFLGHRRHLPRTGQAPGNAQNAQASAGEFMPFLHLSLLSIASLSIPFVLATYRNPKELLSLDDECDAATTCGVARRASVSQGRALLSVWERSFAPFATTAQKAVNDDVDAEAALKSLSAALRAPKIKSGDDNDDIPRSHAHFAPTWGVVTRYMSLSESSAAYTFLFSHARAVVSAAVRASVLGPYTAQAELANPNLRIAIEKLVDQFTDTKVEDAAQRVPAVDLWMGRHEKLYSRIFNS